MKLAKNTKMTRIKLLNSISLILIPILMATLYLVKNFYYAIPIFLIGIVLQILLYQEHRKRETHKSFLKDKSGAVLVGVILLGYFFVKNTFF